MSDADALLRVIWEQPDEDMPRLMCADWLDEHAGMETVERRCSMCYEGKQNDCEPGDLSYNEWDCQSCMGTGKIVDSRPNGFAERAEFIRVQCRIAGLESQQGSPDFWAALRTAHEKCHGCGGWCRAVKRERELLAANWIDWHSLPQVGWACLNLAGDPLPERVRHGNAIRFARGFVDEVRLTAAAFVGDGRTPGLAAAIGAHPVTRVVLTDAEPWEDEKNGGFRWNGEADSDMGGIHRAIARLIPYHPEHEKLDKYIQRVTESVVRTYPTEQAANAVLSAACVRHARQEFQKTRGHTGGHITGSTVSDSQRHETA